jgi:hypothetical protein
MRRNTLPYVTIYILTFLDVSFTYIGLCTGSIEEANPFLRYLIQHSLLFTMIGILIFVAAVLYFFYRVSSRIKWMSAALKGIIGIKFGVLMMHAVWVFNI